MRNLFLIVTLLFLPTASRAEPPIVVERIVPPGASLTYSENGVAVRSVNVPPGRVRVTIEFGGSIVPRHRRRK